MGSKYWTECDPTFSGCVPDGFSWGCANCYARTMARRFGNPDFLPKFDLEALQRKLAKFKNRPQVFFNSMGDPFVHKCEQLQQWLDLVTTVGREGGHEFLLLTKNTKAMAKCWINFTHPNVHLGVTIESDRFDCSQQRKNHLLQFEKKHADSIRWISYEPLLAPIEAITLEGIDWVVVGGESGAKARLCEAWWIEKIYTEAKKRDCKFFFKQRGNNFRGDLPPEIENCRELPAKLAAILNRTNERRGQ